LQELQASYIDDAWASTVLEGKIIAEESKNKISIHQGIIRVKCRIYVGSSSDWRAKVILTLHDSSVGGHSGIQGTYQRVHKLFYWPKLKDQVIQIVQNYNTRQLNKGENIASLGFLQPIPIPQGPLSVISMDFIYDLSKNMG
jgi:Integrase zinc binding domain